MSKNYPRSIHPKKCTKCGEVKPAEAFNRDKKNKEGLHCWCKECRTEDAKTKNYPRSIHPKKCTKCGEVKPAEAFNSNKRNKEGLQDWCKECQSEQIKQRYKNHSRDYQLTYFVTDNYQPTIKIGRTLNLKNTLTTYKRGSPTSYYIGIIEEDVEAILHTLLRTEGVGYMGENFEIPREKAVELINQHKGVVFANLEHYENYIKGTYK